MNRLRIFAPAVAICLLIAVKVFGQTQRSTDGRSPDAIRPAPGSVEQVSHGGNSTVASDPQAIVPRLMKFSGVLHDATGKPLTGTVDVTFSLYNSEVGGDALWFETQSLQADELGRYTALLGTMHADGLPMDLFASGEVRWLGAQVGQEAEQQPRVLLVSVPYALKAGDAETLGGKPASAYMLSDSQDVKTSVIATTSSTGTATKGGRRNNRGKSLMANTSPLAACAGVTSDGSAVTSSIALFTNPCNIQSSAISQSGNNIGIGTTPTVKLHVADDVNPIQFAVQSSNGNGANIALNNTSTIGGAKYIRSLGGNLQVINNAYSAALITIQDNGNVGIGTTVPSVKLHVADDVNPFQVVVQSASVGGAALYLDNTGSLNGGKFIRSLGGNLQVLNSAYSAALMTIQDGGDVGIGTTTPAALLDVAGPINAKSETLSGNTAGGTQVLNVIQNGAGTGLSVLQNSSGGTSATIIAPSDGTAVMAQGGTAMNASTDSTTGTAILAAANATSGNTVGLNALVKSSGGSAIQANAIATTGSTYGVQATIHSPLGTAVFGYAPETTGSVSGVAAYVESTSAVAGTYQNHGGGTILAGFGSGTTPVFRLDGTGKGFFDGGTQIGGADFAESVAVLGERSKYSPGDLLVIDSSGRRRLALTRTAYSTHVAGIYSTKPGVLATPHNMDNAQLMEEVALAVVGIVPCKVTALNGPIHVGDLLVSSSIPGYAMKGTNRRLMLGAVVGKAMEPLTKGTGVIQVLVTLQ